MNNKGMTITEIIVSISLVSIVLVFLFNIIITVNNSNSKIQNESTEIINKGIIIKEIEKDFKDLTLKEVSYCSNEEVTETDLYKRIFSPTVGTDKYCLKFTYDLSDQPGFLVYYNIMDQNNNNIIISTNIGYIRKDKKVLRETKITPKPTTNDTETTNGIVEKSCNNTNCLLSINLKVIGEDGEDYGIDLSYYFQSDSVTFNTLDSLEPKYGFYIKP